MFNSLIERLDNYKRYRNTVDELSRLSDRELSDIGITRSNIKVIARKPRI